jgi:hypothetical protein
MEKMKQRKGNALIALLIVVTLATLGIIGSAIYKGQPKQKVIEPPSITTARISQTTARSSSTSSVSPAISYCNCTWAVTGPTSVEFLITSPSGIQQGYLQATKTYVYDILDASYGIESGIGDATGQGSPTPAFLYFGMNNAQNGTYDLQVIAKTSGNYHLDISVAWNSENSKKLSVDGKLELGQIDKYTVSFPDGIVQKVNN